MNHNRIGESVLKSSASKEAGADAIDVSVAILIRGEQVWIQQRSGTDHLNDHWEFPGGKVEQGETVVETLVREVLEETGCRVPIELIQPIRTDLFRYSDRLLRLHFFLCLVPAEEKPRRNLNNGRWVRRQEIGGFRMPPANQKIIEWLLDSPTFSGLSASF